MKRFVLMLTLAAATMAADCPGGDDSTGPNGDASAIVGTWTLVSFNNDPIPSNWNDNGVNRTITSGSIIVNANMTFTFHEIISGIGDDVTSGNVSLTTPPATFTLDPTEGTGEPNQNNGTAVVSGNTLTLTVADGGTTNTRVYSRN